MNDPQARIVVLEALLNALSNKGLPLAIVDQFRAQLGEKMIKMP